MAYKAFEEESQKKKKGPLKHLITTFNLGCYTFHQDRMKV